MTRKKRRVWRWAWNAAAIVCAALTIVCLWGVRNTLIISYITASDYYCEIGVIGGSIGGGASELLPVDPSSSRARQGWTIRYFHLHEWRWWNDFDWHVRTDPIISISGDVPLCFAIPTFGLLPSLWLLQYYRNRDKRLPYHCHECGYNLTGTVAAGQTECPECGTAIEPERIEQLKDKLKAMHGACDDAHSDGESPSRADEAFLIAYLAERDVACPHCGHNLRGATRPSCPECGEALMLSVGPAAPFFSWYWIVSIMALTLGSGLGFIFLVGVAIKGPPSSSVQTPWIPIGLSMGLIPTTALTAFLRRPFSKRSKNTQRVLALISVLVGLTPLLWIFLYA